MRATFIDDVFRDLRSAARPMLGRLRVPEWPRPRHCQ